MATCREASKRNWTSCDSAEQINMGSLQRIADACELMAKRYSTVIEERDRYFRWYESERKCSKRLSNSNSALRGVITKVRNRLNKELEKQKTTHKSSNRWI